MRHAARSLLRRPAFALTAILTVAAGVAAATTMFTLVNAILLKQLPYEQAEHLVWIWSTRVDRDKAFFSVPDFLDTREQSRLVHLCAYANWGANLTGTGNPERAQGVRITADAFKTLGVRAEIGRALVAGDDDAAGERVVVVSYGLWQRRFGGDPSVLGRKILLNGEPHTLIGVLPPAFVLPAADPDIFVPLRLASDPLRSDRGSHFLRVFGRLKPDVTLEQARAELASITRDLRLRYPNTNAKKTAPRINAFRDEVAGSYRSSLWMLFGAVGILLVIACANLAGLFAARFATERVQMTIRAALGAKRIHLAADCLRRVAVVAAVGGGLGTLAAVWGVRMLVAFGPPDLPRTSEIAVDTNVVVFAIAVCVMTMFAVGLVPAIKASKTDVAPILRSPGQGGHSSGSMRRYIVGGQVAFALVLLTGAGLLLTSLARLQSTAPGFRPDHVLSIRLSLPPARYATPDALARFVDKYHDQLATLPGVDSSAAVSVLPLSGMNARTEFVNPERPPASPTQVPAAQNRWVTSNYFRTMGIQLVGGREFSEHDSTTTRRVAVVDTALARRYFGTVEVIGKAIHIDPTDTFGYSAVIVGVVGQVKHNTLSDEATPTLYLPLAQITPLQLPFVAGSFHMVIRTANEPLSLVEAARRELTALDPEVPAANIRPLDDVLDATLSGRRFKLRLLGGFGVTSAILAILGLYALMSQLVTARTAEFGIRLALGATPGSIMRNVLSASLRIVIAGSAVGLLLSATLIRFASASVMDASGADALTIGTIIVLFAVVAVASTYIPARRLWSLEANQVLRSE